jgi:cytochrome c peroxidase
MAALPVAAASLFSAFTPGVRAMLGDREAAALRRIAHPPLGLPPLPGDAQLTAQMISLGRKLFFDRSLSSNGTMSCAMCHVPEQGFTNNELATPLGVEGRSLRRNAPTLLNVAHATALFHDGRDGDLETQALMPLLDRREMANPSLGHLIARLRQQPEYATAFKVAFGTPVNAHTLGQALAAYERTLLSANAPFDRWRYGNEAEAMSPEAARGFVLFAGKAGCASCHLIGERHALFTDYGFHNTGTYELRGRGSTAPVSIKLASGFIVELPRHVVRSVGEPEVDDDGRLEVTGRPEDLHRFKTPSLRNVALTAPYMHDGSLAGLYEVVRYYDRGGSGALGQDPRIRPLNLSDGDIHDLVAFLQSLTGDNISELVREAREAD